MAPCHFCINCKCPHRTLWSAVPQIARHIQKHPRPQTEALNEGICIPDYGNVIVEHSKNLQLFACRSVCSVIS